MPPLVPRRSRGRCACPIPRSTGFPVEIAGRPPQLRLYEATSRFTRVTTCRFALPPSRDFVGSLGQRVLPLAPDPSLWGRQAFTPVGTSQPTRIARPSLGTCRVGEWRRGCRFQVACPASFRAGPQSQRTIPGFHPTLIKPYVRFSLIRLSCENSVRRDGTPPDPIVRVQA
jgi:hypothetical protein